jgi:excisionase family DNA binding protein
MTTTRPTNKKTAASTARLLTVEEVASRWKMHPDFVRRQQWSGELRATRMGRFVRFSEAEVARWERRHTDS